MTDNEIVKALEFCADSRDTDKHCLKCPYCNESYCLDKMMADALSLINRQKAEIETLKMLLSTSNIELAGADDEEECVFEECARG